MGIKVEDVERWVQLGFTLASGVPGAVGAILSFIQQFAPLEVQQEWTQEKISSYLANYDFEQDKIKDEFDERRTDEPEN